MDVHKQMCVSFTAQVAAGAAGGGAVVTPPAGMTVVTPDGVTVTPDVLALPPRCAAPAGVTRPGQLVAGDRAAVTIPATTVTVDESTVTVELAGHAVAARVGRREFRPALMNVPAALARPA